MQKISCFFIILCVVFIQNITAQEDCILGVGVTDNETIISVFQLNEEQAEKLANLSAELKYRNELLNSQIENTRKKNPKSSEEDLMKLAKEYKIVMDSVGKIQRTIDKKVLSLFNKKQYNRYMNLCQEAFVRPIHVVPVDYNTIEKNPK